MLQSDQSRILAVSNIYETEPWGVEDQNRYLNQVVKMETVLKPQELLDTIHLIEAKCGRKRGKKRYESRTLDIDILFYDSIILLTEKLTIPHPLLHQRLFVLVPMSELAPDFRHPVLGKTITELTVKCDDTCIVTRIT